MGPFRLDFRFNVVPLYYTILYYTILYYTILVVVGKSTSKQHFIIIDDELGVMDIFRDKEGKKA